MHKSLSNKLTFKFIAVLLLVLLVLPQTPVSANASVIPATGGSSISVDTAGVGGTGTYTSLTGPVINEGSNRDINTGTIILNAPSGFEFNPAATVTVAVAYLNGSTGGLTLSSPTAIVTSDHNHDYC